MIYAIILLAIIAIYQHFRISYVRDKWTELLKEKVELVRWSSKDSETLTNILKGYYEKISIQLNEKYRSDVRRWCVEQAIKLAPINGSIEGVVNSIESYIEHGYYPDNTKSPQERFDKIKDKKPDLSKIKEMLNEKIRFVDINLKRKNESTDDFIKRCKDENLGTLIEY